MKRALALSLALVLAGTAHAAETLRYVALVDNGKEAGHQVVTTGDDGITRVDYVFKDNGRGPELKEEFKLAPDGTFTSYHVTGSTTFGAPVDDVSGTIAPEGTRVTLAADESLRIRAGNAGAVRISLNGIGLGAIGEDGEVIEWRISRSGG